MEDQEKTKGWLVKERNSKCPQSARAGEKASPDSSHVEEELRRLTHGLSERIKELDCLYGISNLIETPDISMEGILRGAVELLPRALQYPSLACARILLQEQTYMTEDFQESPWRLASDIKVQGQPTGRVELFYQQKPSPIGQEPFLSEEVRLLNAVANRLSRIIERKRTEEALRESELVIHTIAEQLEDLLFATDNRGFITFASPSALRMFGWKPEEMVGRNFIDFLTEQEIPGAASQFKNGLASGQKTRNLSFVMKRKDESTFPGEVNSSLIWKEGHAVGKVGIIRDITERRRAEEVLRESEERYRNQVEAINDVAYAVGSRGEITYISPVVKDLLGYEPDEINGRHFLEFVHHEDRNGLTRRFSELHEGVASHDEYRVMGKSGDIKWVRSLTTPIFDVGGFVGGRGILVDISERKQAEQALRESEARLRAFFSQAAVGVAEIEIGTGRFLTVNRCFCEMVGRTEEEMLATTFLAITHPEDLHLHEDKTALMVAEKIGHYELQKRYIRKDGAIIWVNLTSSSLWKPGETPMRNLVVVQNITEQKKAEEALRESEEKFRTIFDRASEGILIADTITHKFLQGNATICSMLGYSEEEIVNLTLKDIHPPNALSRVLDEFEKQIKGEKILAEDLPVLRKDGSIFYAEVGSAPAVIGGIHCLVGIFRDITERKRAEEERQEIDDRFRLAINATKEGLWEWNLNTNQEFFSPRWCEILGYSYEDKELPHRYDSWASRIHPDDYDRVIKALQNHLENGTEYNVDYRHRHKSGEYRWQNSRGQAVLNENGKPIKMVGCIADITAHKQTEQLLRRQREELSHVTRLATVGEFAASIAHEIHQPLTAILNNAQAAQRFLSTDIAEVQDALQDIIDDDRRAADVIHHLRSFLRKKEANRTILDVNRVIEEVMTILHGELIDRNINVIPELSPDLPHIEGSRVEIQQVLMNLILNGCDAMADVDLQYRQISVRTSLDEPNGITVAVQDSGTGLGKSAMDRLFQPYFTTKQEGLGMGLSISKSIISAHGGRIWAVNNPAGGATFFFTLPLQKEKTAS